MHRIDAPGSTVDNQFQPENPALGIQATELGAEWHNAIQEEIARFIEEAGLILDKADNTQLLQALRVINATAAPVRLAIETTLTAAHGLIFFTPPEGETVLFHLPVYATVSAHKKYLVINKGQGLARLDAADAKTIDGQLTMDFAPGDRGEIVKDSDNWETI